MQGIEAVKLAVNLGFKSVSADVIIGLPGQTCETLGKSLETLCGLGVQHLSVYCLSLEDGTPLATHPPQDLPSDEEQADLFERACSFLADRGFVHYEISNFALRGHECLHNLNYWRGGEYTGLGPAAASHVDGKRFKNRADLGAYVADPTGQIEYVEQLSPREKAAEEAMLRLRLLEEGLDITDLAAKFGHGIVPRLTGRLERLTGEGLLVSDGTTYRLPLSHVLTSNPIFARVLGD
jgi:oxygen-independent coproporphyrinogen-3 oxidase